MNITVTEAAANTVTVTQAVSTATAVALTVQPELAGFFLERVGVDGWTIWFEDGN